MDCAKNSKAPTTSSHFRAARSVTADGWNSVRGPATTQKHKLSNANGNSEDLQCHNTTMQRGVSCRF
jgi:hypothetical protein